MHKLTRPYIASFVRTYATEAPTLNIGVGGTAYRDVFPNLMTLDIDPNQHPDVVGDAHALPFADASFDLVICSEVMEHLDDPRTAIQEMRRVLTLKGVLVVTTRFAYPVHDAPSDYWRFTPYGLKKLFDGWEIVSFETDGGPFMAIAIQLQRILFQTDLRGGKLTKGFLFPFVLLFSKLDRLVRTSYGQIGRTGEIPHLLSSGVFLACRKL